MNTLPVIGCSARNVHIADTPHPSHCWDTICYLTWPSCWRSSIIHCQVRLLKCHICCDFSSKFLSYHCSSFFLPSAQYEQFKKTLHSLFPVTVDTKNLCHGLRKVIHTPISSIACSELIIRSVVCAQKLEDTNMLEFSNLQELYDALQK